MQASLDLAPDDQPFDAGHYTGIELDVYGNGESYNVHLRTADTWIVWQSYRASFAAPPQWRTVRLPFSGFEPYRTSAPLDLKTLKRIGLVAIAREMQADCSSAAWRSTNEAASPMTPSSLRMTRKPACTSPPC